MPPSLTGQKTSTHTQTVPSPLFRTFLMPLPAASLRMIWAASLLK